jgi:hypothetical protein
MLVTPQNVIVAIFVIAPGFVATILAMSLSAVEKNLSNGRVLTISLVSSLVIDSLFLTIVQSLTTRSITGPNTVTDIFFTPNFQPEYPLLLIVLSLLLGIVYSIGLILNLHGRTRELLWDKIRRQDGRSRDPWQPWEGTLRDAGLVKVLTSNGDVIAGKVYEFSRVNKPRQLRLFEPEVWDSDESKFEESSDEYVLLFEEDIERLYVLLTSEEMRKKGNE